MAIRIGLCSTALSTLICTAALAQAPAETASGSAPTEAIATEVLVAPIITRFGAMNYPFKEILENGEGWVQVGAMVDPNGKPFEVTVISSSGNKAFEEAAIKSFEGATIKPGMLNGKPIDSSTRAKVVYKLSDAAHGARPEFIRAYKSLSAAVAAKDRTAADAAMKLLRVNNLYEDAYFGLATYMYARQWGDEAQQLAGLRRAIATETGPDYLSRDEFHAVLLECFRLQVSARRYSEALTTWDSIVSSKTDPAQIKKLEPLIHELHQIQLAHQPYEISDSISDDSWGIGLFENNFRLLVSDGHISQIKLRCAKGFVRFKFDPALDYNVATRYGSCTMEIDGDTGTKFTLTQF